MFIVRLKTYLERWMKLFETPQTYDGFRDLFIREQFLDVSPVDLSIYLGERKLPTLDEVAQSADLFQSINQSINKSNFSSARLSGATAKSVFNSKIEKTVP